MSHKPLDLESLQRRLDEGTATLEDGLRLDVLTGNSDRGLNPGDAARWRAEAEASEQAKAEAQQAALEKMVDAALERAKGGHR